MRPLWLYYSSFSAVFCTFNIFINFSRPSPSPVNVAGLSLSRKQGADALGNDELSFEFNEFQSLPLEMRFEGNVLEGKISAFEDRH